MIRHPLNILRILAVWLVFAVGALAGLVMLPLALAFTPRASETLRWRWADHIWGNEQDGIEGDSFWYPAIKKDGCPGWVASQGWFIRTFPRFWWGAIRNPAHNLALNLGYEATLTKRSIIGRQSPHGLGLQYIEAHVLGRDGFMRNPYPFYYWQWLWPGGKRYGRFIAGWKTWANTPTGRWHVAHFGVSFTPFRTLKDMPGNQPQEEKS